MVWSIFLACHRYPLFHTRVESGGQSLTGVVSLTTNRHALRPVEPGLQIAARVARAQGISVARPLYMIAVLRRIRRKKRTAPTPTPTPTPTPIPTPTPTPTPSKIASPARAGVSLDTNSNPTPKGLGIGAGVSVSRKGYCFFNQSANSGSMPVWNNSLGIMLTS